MNNEDSECFDELDEDGWSFSNDANVDTNFVGDNRYFNESFDTPKLSDWKNNDTDINATCNRACEDMDHQFRYKIIHTTNKINESCHKVKVTFEDLEEIKCGMMSPMIQAFLKIRHKIFK